MRVSVITICFNSRTEIAGTIESVLTQKKKCNVEYIIIDGASTDGTLDIISQYANSIDVIVSEPDSGIYDAMNKGIRMATGDVIGFINCGDLYSDGGVEAVVSCFINTDADVVYGDVVYTHAGDAVRVRKAADDASEMLTSMVTCHQGIFVRTEIQKKHEFDLSYKIAADRKMLLDLFLKGFKFVKVDSVLAYYDDAGFSSSHRYELQVENYKITYQTSLKYPQLYSHIVDDLKEDVFLFDFWHDWMKPGVGVNERVRTYFYSVIDRNKKIYIWGVGYYGEKSERLFAGMDYEIRGFIDSHPKMDYLGDYYVLTPEKVRVDKEDVLIIATRKYADEIEEDIDSYFNLKKLPRFRIVDMIIDCEEYMGKSMESILKKEN